MEFVHIIKLVPPDEINGKILYAGTDGKFYNKHGKRLKPAFNKAKRERNNSVSGKVYPSMRHFANAYCHRLIGRTFLRELREGEVYDHINGDITNYSIINLRIVTKEINYRDAGFLRKLRNKGIDPTMFPQAYLLRYFDRMADFKSSHNRWQYQCLTAIDLLKLLDITPPSFDELVTHYRSTVLRSTPISDQELADAQAVWDHMTPVQRVMILRHLYHRTHGILLERLDYTLAHFVGQIINH